MLEEQVRKKENDNFDAQQEIEHLRQMIAINPYPDNATHNNSMQASQTVSIQNFAAKHQTQDDIHIVHQLRKPREKSRSSSRNSDKAASLRASQRTLQTNKTIAAANDNNWECEYRLLENENGRLKKEVDNLQE